MEDKKEFKKNKSKQQFSRRKSRHWEDGSTNERSMERKQDRSVGQNDIDWYCGSTAELAAMAGQVAFSNALGSYNGWSGDSASALTVKDGSATDVPGIMAFRTITTLGVSDNPSSPLNVASRLLYNNLIYTLSSKISDVEAPDFMIYLKCVDDMYAFYAYMGRIYKTFFTYYARNKYFAKTALEMMGVSYADMIQHSNDLRQYITQFKAKVNRTLRIPKQFSAVKRHVWLYSNIFSDSPDEKSQSYMYVPAGWYKWAPKVTTPVYTGSAAKFVKYACTRALGTKLTVSELIQVGEELFQAMATDADVNTITAYMLRAYGDEGCFVLADLDLDSALERVYQPEILGQIHNLMMVNIQENEFQSDSLDIRQNAGSDDFWLQWKPYKNGVTIGVNGLSMGLPGALPLAMDSFTEKPDWKEVIINSRGMYLSEISAVQGTVENWTYRFDITACGLDLVLSAVVACQHSNGTVTYYPIYQTGVGLDSQLVENTAIEHSLFSKFDWAPRLYLLSTTAAGKLFVEFDSWDYNNFTQISRSALEKMHTAATLGALDLSKSVTPYRNNG